MKSDTLKIARWELLRYLGNKQYLISLIVTPVLMVLLMAIPSVLSYFDKPKEATFYIVDEISILPMLREEIPQSHIKLKQAGNSFELAQTVYDEKAVGYLVIDSTFWQNAELEFHYNKLNPDALAIIRSALNRILGNHRLQETGIAREDLTLLTQEAEIRQFALQNAESMDKNVITVTIIFMAVIYFMIFSSGTMLMQSALQERRDRMAEIVLSSIKPISLMQGKILGHFLLALIQVVFWLVISIPGIIFFLKFPLFSTLQIGNLGIMLFFGLAGYMLYSALYVSIGATMDDMQSAGNTQSLMMVLPMFSLLFIQSIVSNPDGMVSRFAGFFPLSSPLAIVIRSAFVKIPLWELLLSALILIASIYLVSQLAAKIFRVGMLMYGKTADFKEIMRWIKYKN
jgi:ABC-2 type transport system permease protein